MAVTTQSRDPHARGEAPSAAALRTAWIPLIALTAGTALLLIQILVLNGGKLVYTLDDPYIHLAVAENIARGEYGVNPGEPSAPSSSILYPFLFAPFAGLSILEWLPLALGFVASLATVALWCRIVGPALAGRSASRAAGGERVIASAGQATDPERTIAAAGPERVITATDPERTLPAADRATGRQRIIAAAAVTLLIPTTNLVGVMFTGMEHSLQLFATALLIAGLVVERERRMAPWWLWLAIVLGPLVRYENLALSVPALGYLFVRGERGRSLIGLAVLASLVGGFSLFLLASGHGALPTSVLLKTGAMDPGRGPDAVLARLVGNLLQRQGALLAVLGATFAGAAFGAADRDDRQLAAWAAVAVGLHMVRGTFGWFSRYELYIWTAALLTAIVLFRGPLRRLTAAVRLLPLGVGAMCAAIVLGFPYIYTTLKTPLGSNNIYEQQYQMHRFVTEYWDGPVAVTDLGWVSFRNDRYVLDLFGLAHRGAGQARLHGHDTYVDDLTRSYDVHLAMLYGNWYPDLPARWRPVAEMRLGKQRLTPAGEVVTFYALDPAAEPRIRALLAAFAGTLPKGVGFTLLP